MRDSKLINPKNPSYKKLLNRLNRIGGQVEGIKKMIQEERYCPDILIQLSAVRSAVKNLEIEIFENHISHCVLQAFDDQEDLQKLKKLEEIKFVIKRFN
tara:strand:+ start:277 stop:573 length:297 start_codon:yes stop_codon:yes gene_type:complete